MSYIPFAFLILDANLLLHSNLFINVDCSVSQKVHGEDEIGMLTLTMYGSDVDVIVMSLTEYQLSCHMHEPEPIDFGNYVLSPMPGTLISFAVKVRCIVEITRSDTGTVTHFVIILDSNTLRRRAMLSNWAKNCV